MDELSLPVTPGVEYRIIPRCSKYAAGSDGSIWSRANERIERGAWVRRSPGKANNGYLRVDLYDGEFIGIFGVHRLVLEAFVGPCPEGMQACHNNGNKLDNRPENLRWDTGSNNCQDRRRHGTALLGKKNHRARLTEADVQEIRRLKRETGMSGYKISLKLGFNKQAVLHVISGKTWSHLPEETQPDMEVQPWVGKPLSAYSAT